MKARRDQVAQHLQGGIDTLDGQHQRDREHQHRHLGGAQAQHDTQPERHTCGDDVHHEVGLRPQQRAQAFEGVAEGAEDSAQTRRVGQDRLLANG